MGLVMPFFDTFRSSLFLLLFSLFFPPQRNEELMKVPENRDFVPFPGFFPVPVARFLRVSRRGVCCRNSPFLLPPPFPLSFLCFPPQMFGPRPFAGNSFLFQGLFLRAVRIGLSRPPRIGSPPSYPFHPSPPSSPRDCSII